MKTYQQKLEDYLECSGWEISSKDSDHNFWWADDFWLLKSTWSPVGSVACLTFLVDPMFDGLRKAGEAVWAVGSSKYQPIDSNQAKSNSSIVLDKKFKENIEEFLDSLEELRGKNKT